MVGLLILVFAGLFYFLALPRVTNLAPLSCVATNYNLGYGLLR